MSPAPPDAEWVSDFWRHRAIDATSVHIIGKSACLVTVPLAAHQLAECMDITSPEEGRTRYELTWLARSLAQDTSFLLRHTGAWSNLEDALRGKLKDVDVLHKYEEQDFGGEPVYVRACWSVRLAYCTVVEEDTGESREIAHIYCAMGLRKQHNFQQIILGRFKDLTIGAHFLAAVCS